MGGQVFDGIPVNFDGMVRVAVLVVPEVVHPSEEKGNCPVNVESKDGGCDREDTNKIHDDKECHHDGAGLEPIDCPVPTIWDACLVGVVVPAKNETQNCI